MKAQPGDVIIALRPVEHANPNVWRRLAKLLKAIKRAYGFVVVEGPRDAKFGMKPATEPDCKPGCPTCRAQQE